MAETAMDAAGGVVEVAKAEGAQVAQDVRMNARLLLHQTKGELAEQAAIQQQRVAEGLWSVSDELSTMANASQDGGVATDLVRQAAQRSSSVAAWLENRDPGSLLEEVKDFARRRPGTFLLLAAGAGVLAGRLGRGMADTASPDPAVTTTTAPRADDYSSAGSYTNTGGYSTTGGAVPPPPVDLPGPQVTTAGYGTTPNTGYGTSENGALENGASGSGGMAGTGPAGHGAGSGYDPGVVYDAGTTVGAQDSPAAYPGRDPGRLKAHGDPLAGSLDRDNPEYGGTR